jgi:hypothetical protein
MPDKMALEIGGSTIGVASVGELNTRADHAGIQTHKL